MLGELAINFMTEWIKLILVSTHDISFLLLSLTFCQNTSIFTVKSSQVISHVNVDPVSDIIENVSASIIRG
jgi:hypothetical protein